MGDDEKQKVTSGDVPETTDDKTQTNTLKNNESEELDSSEPDVNPSDGTATKPSEDTRETELPEAIVSEPKLDKDTDDAFVVDVKEGSSKKKKLIIVGVIVALLALFFGYWFVLRDTSEPVVTENTTNQVTPIGMSLTLVEGTVEYSDNEGVLWQTATSETEITVGNWLRTGEADGSRAIITFDDGSALRVNKNSQIELTQSNSDGILAQVTKGEAYARVVTSENRLFEVSTERIGAQALGTAFIVGTESGKDYVEVYQSKIKEKSTDTEVGEGKSLEYTVGSGQSEVKDLDIEQIKLDEFVTWNRQKDSETTEFKDKLGFLDDIESPDLNVTAPTNNSRIEIPIGSSSVNVTFRGTTEAGLNVSVTGTDGANQEVTAGEDGAFSLAVTGRAGRVDYTVSTVDKAGNKSKILVAVTYVQQVAEAPVLDITLGAVADNATGKVKLNWTYRSGFEAPDGVKVLWNRSGNLTFPVKSAFSENGFSNFVRHSKRGKIVPAVTNDNDCTANIYGSQYITDSTSTSICLRDGLSYAFRVCRYDSSTSTCDVYSNEVRLTAPGGSS